MTEVLEAIAGIGPVPLALIWVATVAAARLRSVTGFGFALAGTVISMLNHWSNGPSDQFS